jgi:hypothetical protein
MMTHQGWSNFETFVVTLWMENEQESQEHWALQARRVSDDTETEEDAVDMLSDVLEHTHLDWVARYQLRGFAADLMSSAMQDVNWREIAEHLLAE